MSQPEPSDETVFVASDLALRPSCTSVGAWLVSWGEGTSRETLEVKAELASALAALPSQVELGRLRELLRPLLSGEDADTLITYLLTNRLLLRQPTATPPSEQKLLAMNWADALVLHRATRGMLWRHEYPENAQVMTWTNHDIPVSPAGPRPQVTYDDLPDSVVLCPPDQKMLHAEVERVFAERRTKRNFRGTTVSDVAVSTLLHIVFRPVIQGANRRYFTTLSSADGYREQAELHPITAYALFSRPDVLTGQKDAVYRYNPGTHALQSVRTGSLPRYFSFSELLWGQDFADDAPAALLLSVNWAQFMWKYRTSHAYRFAHYDLGAYMQTALLAATALGLGTFITPALDDIRVSRLLGTNEHVSSPTYFLAIGSGADHRDDSLTPYL